MRIGFLIDDSLDRPDGVQQYVLGLGKYYENNGHSVFYLAGETKRKDIKNSYSLAKAVKVSFNGNVLSTPLPANNEQIVKILSKIKLDVLHVQMPYSPLLAGRVIKSVSPKTVVIGTLHIYPNSWTEERLGKLLNIVNHRTLKRLNKVIAVSSPALETSGLSKKINIQIIPNHINLTNYKKTNLKNDTNKSIVFLGRLVKRKGCQQLLEAIKLLKHQRRLPTGVKVYIAGDGPNRHRLEKFVKNNKLSSVVSFLGFVPEEQKGNFLSRGSIAVFPSSGGESFGIVLLEAMSAGCAVLAGNNPGYASLLGVKSNQLFDTSNTAELADKIELLINSKKLREKICSKQHQMLANYDINIVANKVEQIYKHALRTGLSM